MTAENFDEVLITLLDLKPFQIFTVELNGGRKVGVDHPRSMVIRKGVAVYIAPGGTPVFFDHDSVNRIIKAPASTDA